MDINENQVPSSAPVVVPALDQIEAMTKADLLKLKADVLSGVSAVDAAIEAYTAQEVAAIKAEAEAKWKVFFDSSSFKAIHLSLTTITLVVGIVLLLVK